MSGLSNLCAVTDAEFDALMRGFAAAPPFGMAVSGGPDSIALALLMLAWTRRHSFPAPVALIVDHALRTDSSREASEVKARLEKLGIETEILHWDHAPVTSRLHDQARKARYALLLEACHKRGIGCLTFAHQREDQAETILMRLAKGSGIDGLAGIASDSVIEGVRILRPLLNMPKVRLVALCEQAGISYVKDPSNESELFARCRLRRVLPLLAREGMTVARLVDCGRRAAEARDAIEHYTHEFLTAHSRRDIYGTLSIDKTDLLAQPRAVAIRALGYGLRDSGPAAYAPQYTSLARLLESIATEEILKPRTLNGCLVRQNQNRITVSREYAAITESLPIEGGQSVAWDGRWQVSLAEGSGSYVVRALGNQPHTLLDQLAPTLRRKIPQGRIRASLPALWQADRPVLVPLPGSESPAEAKLKNAWPPMVL